MTLRGFFELLTLMYLVLGLGTICYRFLDHPAFMLMVFLICTSSLGLAIVLNSFIPK